MMRAGPLSSITLSLSNTRDHSLIRQEVPGARSLHHLPGKERGAGQNVEQTVNDNGNKVRVCVLRGGKDNGKLQGEKAGKKGIMLHQHKRDTNIYMKVNDLVIKDVGNCTFVSVLPFLHPLQDHHEVQRVQIHPTTTNT